MEKLKAFQDVARINGFVDVEETDDGTVLWLKKPTANAEDRMCVDSLTNSVTVFWATMPWKINSKTFRAVSALQEWFTLTSRQAASMTNRDALLRLAVDKNDAPAMAALCENNAELLRSSVARYFESGAVSEKAKSIVMQRVAEHARSYHGDQEPDQWLAKSLNSECDRVRNEAIQAKANKRLTLKGNLPKVRCPVSRLIRTLCLEFISLPDLSSIEKRRRLWRRLRFSPIN